MGRYQNNQLKATVYALATSHSREVETSARNPGIVQVEVKEARYDCRALLFVHDVSMLFVSLLLMLGED